MSILEVLPKDIISLILSNLDPNHVLNLCSVSKVFYAISTDNYLWHQFVCKSEYKHLSDNNLYNYKSNFILENFLKRAGLDFSCSFTRKKLRLTHKSLIRIPTEICELTNLKGLYLNHTKLIEIPKEIGLLFNLHSLELSYNNLTAIPKELCKLINLEGLNLSYNYLTELPSELGQLSKLRYLYLHNNKLTAVPKEFCQLINLKKLYLCSNAELRSIPKELIDLKSFGCSISL